MADLRSRAYARILDLISEGEIGGLVAGRKSIYLNGTPLESENGTVNFSGVVYEQRTGTNAQSHITTVPGVENEISVGTELTNGLPIVRTISDSDVDAVRVRVKMPNLFYQETNGTLSARSVDLKIEVQADGEAYRPFYGGSRNWTDSGITKTSPTQVTMTDAAGIRGRIYSLADATGTFALQYKATTSGTWITLGSVNFTTTTTNYSEVDWDFGWWNTWSDQDTTFTGFNSNFSNPNTGENFISFEASFAPGNYDFRIIQTAGTGGSFAFGEGAILFTGSFFGDGIWTLEGNLLRAAQNPTLTISGKTTDEYERSYLIPLTGSAPWNIRVSRLTADSTDVRLSDKTFWESYTEVVDNKLRYPNSAIIGIKFDSEYFQGVPSRAYDVKLLKVRVPSNYNPVTRTYTGVWNGTFKSVREWTDNPAWCFYDLITNGRYGLGQYIPESQVDKWALYTIARYCDELVSNGKGGTEPRFTCNIYIQSRKEAYNVIQDMASIFRGMAYWATGQITVSQDAPSDPVALFTTANVQDGLFNYQGSASKARHTVAMVTWNDPDDMYRQKIEYVEDTAGIARYGVIQTQIIAVGCTSRGQANRVGRWLLYSELNETETVTFRTGIEGCLARPGQVIKVADPTRAGVRLGGRISSATTTAITVDADFSLPASSTVFVQLPSGAVESKTVASKSGRVVTLSSALSAAPQAGASWVLSAPSVEAQTFRVISVQETEDINVEITALKHEPLKYAAVENGLKLPNRDFTNLTLTPAAPASVVLSEAMYTYNAEVRVRINVGWTKVSNAKEYRVEWIRAGGNISRFETSDNDYEILNITPGSYEVRVYSIGSTGKVSTTYKSATINVLGKTAPPANVTAFDYRVDPNIGVTLTWNPVADLDLQGYEIRRGTAWETAQVIAKKISGNVYTVGEIPSGATTYLIKALDTSGNYSVTAASKTFTIAVAPAPTVTGSFVGQNLVLNWDEVKGTFFTEAYEIRYGSTYAGSISLGTVKGTTFGTKAIWSGTRRFWVAAIDIAGNKGTPDAYDAVVTPPIAVTVTQEVIDNNVLLRWGDATATLPLQNYIVKRGATYATATLIGNISAQFSVIFENVAGNFKYWVAGVDIAGNVGTPSSVDARVAEPPDYVLKYDTNSTFNGTKSNFIPVDSGSTTYIVPFDTTKTWETHFTSQSWASPQAQIDAGFPYYSQPSANSGYYEEEFNYGAVIPATKITATLTYQTLTGSVTVTPKISVRKLTTDPWTDYNGLSSVYATNFQYVKIRFTVDGAGGDDLVTVSSLNVRLDVKLKNDAGRVDCDSADVGGTDVLFNVSFVDISSITVTPLGTTPLIAVYDFVDTPNPTGFKVLLFNTSGVRQSGTVSWSVKGV